MSDDLKKRMENLANQTQKDDASPPEEGTGEGSGGGNDPTQSEGVENPQPSEDKQGAGGESPEEADPELDSQDPSPVPDTQDTTPDKEPGSEYTSEAARLADEKHPLFLAQELINTREELKRTRVQLQRVNNRNSSLKSRLRNAQKQARVGNR